MPFHDVEHLALAQWLASELGGKPCHHTAKALRMREILNRWFWGMGVKAFFNVSNASEYGPFFKRRPEVYLTIQRKEWKLSPKRTPNERNAEVLGYVSGRVGPHKNKGRYRPQILLVKGRKRRGNV